MRKFFLALAVLGACACSKKDEGAAKQSIPQSALPAKPPVDGELVITAKLDDIPGEYPANDIYNYAYIMRYKVIKVVQGSYADSVILVGHYNPRFAREEIKDEQGSKVGGNVKSFTVGDVNYLVLTNLEKNWNGAVEDGYFKDKRTRYWALWADKL